MAIVSVRQCPSCGASVSPKQEQCSYCNNYLVQLTPFERRATPAEAGDGADVKYFHSLRRFYWMLQAAGIAGAVYIYVLNFDNFSETEMVQWSPWWFMALVWGMSGLYAERVVKAILQGKADSFVSGLHQATKGMVPIMTVLIYLLFFPPFFLLGLHRWRINSPLLISLSVSLLWGIFLFVFLFGIFPSL